MIELEEVGVLYVGSRLKDLFKRFLLGEDESQRFRTRTAALYSISAMGFSLLQ